MICSQGNKLKNILEGLTLERWSNIKLISKCEEHSYILVRNWLINVKLNSVSFEKNI